MVQIVIVILSVGVQYRLFGVFLRQQILVEIPFQLVSIFFVLLLIVVGGYQILKGIIVQSFHYHGRIVGIVGFVFVITDLPEQHNGISSNNVHAQWNVRKVGNLGCCRSVFFFVVVVFVFIVKPSFRSIVQHHVAVLIKGSKILKWECKKWWLQYYGLFFFCPKIDHRFQIRLCDGWQDNETPC